MMRWWGWLFVCRSVVICWRGGRAHDAPPSPPSKNNKKKNTKTQSSWVQSEFCKAKGYEADCEVIYGDTDSVMVNFKVFVFVVFGVFVFWVCCCCCWCVLLV